MAPSREPNCSGNLSTGSATENFQKDAAEAWGIDEDVLSNDESKNSNYSDELDFSRYASIDYLNLPQPSAPPNRTNVKGDINSLSSPLHSLATRQRVDTFRRLLELSHTSSDGMVPELQRHMNPINSSTEKNAEISEYPTCPSTQAIDDALTPVNKPPVQPHAFPNENSPILGSSPIPIINGYPQTPDDLKIDSPYNQDFLLEDTRAVMQRHSDSFLEEMPKLWPCSKSSNSDDVIFDEKTFGNGDEGEADELLSDYDDNLTKHDTKIPAYHQLNAGESALGELISDLSLLSCEGKVSEDGKCAEIGKSADGKKAVEVQKPAEDIKVVEIEKEPALSVVSEKICYDDHIPFSLESTPIDTSLMKDRIFSSANKNHQDDSSEMQSFPDESTSFEDDPFVMKKQSPFPLLESDKALSSFEMAPKIAVPEKNSPITTIDKSHPCSIDGNLDPQTNSSQNDAKLIPTDPNDHSSTGVPLDFLISESSNGDWLSRFLDGNQGVSDTPSNTPDVDASVVLEKEAGDGLSHGNAYPPQVGDQDPLSSVREQIFFDDSFKSIDTSSCDDVSSCEVASNGEDDYRLENDTLSYASDSGSESQGLIDVSRVHPCISFSWSQDGKAVGAVSFPYPQIRVVKDLSANVFFKAILYRAGSTHAFSRLCLKKDPNWEKNYFSTQGFLLCATHPDPSENELLCEEILLSDSEIQLTKLSDSLCFFMESQFKTDNTLFHFERRLFCAFLQSLLNLQKQPQEDTDSNRSKDSPLPPLIRHLADQLRNGIMQAIDCENGGSVTELETLNRLLLFEKQENGDSGEEPLVDDQIELLRYCLDRPVLLVLFGSSSSAARSSSFISQIGSLIKEQFPSLEVDDWIVDPGIGIEGDSKYHKSARAPFLELVFRAYLIYDQCNLGVQWLKRATLRDPGYLVQRWPYLLLHALQIRPPNGNPSLYLMLAKTFLEVKLAWASQLSFTLAILAEESPPKNTIPIVLFHDSVINSNVSLHLQWLRSYAACVFLQAALSPFKITLKETLEKKRNIIASKWSEFTSKYTYRFGKEGVPTNPSCANEEAPYKRTATDHLPGASIIGPGVTPLVPAMDEKSLVQPIIPAMIPMTQPPRFPATNSFIPPPILENYRNGPPTCLDGLTLASNEGASVASELATENKFRIAPEPTAASEPLFGKDHMHLFGGEPKVAFEKMQVETSEGRQSPSAENGVSARPVEENESQSLDGEDPTFEITKNTFQSNSSLLESIKSFFSSTSLGERGGSRKVRADLGSANQLVFDKELGQWINPKHPRPEPKKIKPPPSAASVNLSQQHASHVANEPQQVEQKDITTPFTQSKLALKPQPERSSPLSLNASLTSSSTISAPVITNSSMQAPMDTIQTMPQDQGQYGMHSTIANFDVSSSELQTSMAITGSSVVRKAGSQRKKYVDPFNLTTPTT
ncbi:hypothetical protein MDAP_001959 [Mitosporidium daphniae]